MKIFKIVSLLVFVGVLFFNMSFLKESVKESKLELKNLGTLNVANAEILDDTYYCFFDVRGGVGFIRICYACNIMPFVWPAGYDGMCYAG